MRTHHHGNTRRQCASAAILALSILATGCASLQSMYLPAQTTALTAPPERTEDTRCEAPAPDEAPAYYAENLRDCTARDTLVAFAFSGGGIRSAAFGYGALQAAHATTLPDAAGGHPFDRDIDTVTGVSGGSFTAAAYASQREKLFPAGKPDYYRDNFLTRNFFSDLLMLYLSPLHWRWLFPNYGTNDEMAEIYAGIEFSSPEDKLFAADFGELAQKGRPFLIVQATDYGNEQPFTFTQNDFDLICADVRSYPVGASLAASSAFPVLFSPIQLVNHHFPALWPDSGRNETAFCRDHRPAWVDEVLSLPRPSDISRLYARAAAAEHYLPSKKTPRAGTAEPRYVYLQDGGTADNVALRGMTNILIQSFPNLNGDTERIRRKLCASSMRNWRKMLVVEVDGEARPDRTVSSLPYLSDLGLILDVTSSTMIDANGFETMLATDAMLKDLAQGLSRLDCGDGIAPQPVKSYFARISFEDLNGATPLANAACGNATADSCTIDDIAHSETSLNFSGAEVDALIDAGRTAFLCNRKMREFLRDSGAQVPDPPPQTCSVDGKP